MAVALDSDAVIGFLDRGDALHPSAEAKVSRLLGSGERLVTSVVSFAEVLTGAMLGRHEEGAVRGFFDQLIAEILPIELDTAERAAELRSEHRSLRMPDALILASADLRPDVNRLVCGDRRMARIGGLDFAVDPLRPRGGTAANA